VCIWNYDKSINIKSKQVLLSSKNQQKKKWWMMNFFLKKQEKSTKIENRDKP